MIINADLHIHSRFSNATSHKMDLDTISLVQKKIKLELQKLKDHAIYSVDTIEKLQYVRGQIRSLEDLQQSLKDLLSQMEYEDEQVHGDTETD